MWTWIHQTISPRNSYRIAKVCQPWVGSIALLLFFYGLFAGLLQAPADYQQGDVFRIMYIHVPAAIWSLTIYVVMSVAAFIFLVWKIKVADIVAKISVPIGASFTALTLITGAIWGKPTWGTFWIWDARLTSELILLFIYFGIMAIRQAIPEPQLAAKASALLTLIGLINIPIVHYSVSWWNTLHQGSSLNLFSASTIAPAMLQPLLVMIFAFGFFYVWLMMLKFRTELYHRESSANWIRQYHRKSQ